MVSNIFCVVLLGDISDKSITKEILYQLSHRFPLIYHNGTILKEYANSLGRAGRGIFIFECGEIENLSCPDCVVILKKSGHLEKALSIINPDIAVIVSADNKKQLEKLKNVNATAITCGLSPMDTVTFSSKGGEKKTISLQRAFKINGRLFEPQEITFEGRSTDDYTMLAASVVNMIADNIFCVE